MDHTVWERIELRYTATTDLEDTSGYRDGVTVWDVDVRLRDEAESTSRSIGEVSAAVTEAAQWDRDERCDMYSAALGAIATALWVRDDEVDLDLEVDPDRDRDFDVLLLELVRLEPERRGSGLGLVITAEIIRILGRGCDAVALLASPWTGDDAMVPRDGSTGRQALARHWTRLGFRPVPHHDVDDVMICVADTAERAEIRARIRDEVLGR